MPGETLGIIGGTGSGKSTLANLIPRFYDCTSGTVRLFGEDVKSLRPADIRRHIGVVPQKATLFSGSLRKNMRWGKEGATDQEICDTLMRTYQKEGMEFKLNAKLLEVGEDSVTYEDAEGKHTLTCDRMLLSAGRRANILGLNLEALQVETNRGAVVTDRHMCTNVPGVYAVGDCNGKLMLAHTAYREAEVAVNHMLGIPDEMRYEAIPSVIYTNPEVACVGETQQSAEAKGMRVKMVKVPMMYAGRYVAETLNGDGFCKLVYDLDYNRLVGVQMIGSYASEMIYGAALMLETELPLSQLKKLVFPHPTVSEVIREGLFML